MRRMRIGIRGRGERKMRRKIRRRRRLRRMMRKKMKRGRKEGDEGGKKNEGEEAILVSRRCVDSRTTALEVSLGSRESNPPTS